MSGWRRMLIQHLYVLLHINSGITDVHTTHPRAPIHPHTVTGVGFLKLSPASIWMILLRFGLQVIKSTTLKMYLTLFLFASVYPRRAQPRDAGSASGWLLMVLTCISRCSKQLWQSSTYSGSPTCSQPHAAISFIEQCCS